MKSTFRSRLFRLFLLFSLIPAFLVALIGYFLASDRDLLSHDTGTSASSAVASYYNTFLSDRIQRALRAHSEDTSANAQLDFLIVTVDSSQELVSSVGTLDSLALVKIAEAARTRPTGIIETNGRFIQFASISDVGGRTYVGGFVQDSAYSGLMRNVQAELSQSTSARVLGASYILFVGVVFAAFALIAILLAAYFSSRYSRALAAPLLDLGDASRKIARGDFNQQVRPRGDSEIIALIENFNTMADQLQTTTARLTQSERVAAWQQVARRFAHELKNPLQPILVSMYRIEKRLKESGQYEQLAEPLRAASDELKHLTELADRFSHLAKLPEPKLELVSLNDLLASIGELYKEQLSTYDFHVELPHHQVNASVDPVYFREALHNLLQNAADASPAGAAIILRLVQTNSGCMIQVQDFGQGMSRTVVASAAIPYFTTKAKGSGLGLAIVERTVNELGGELRIDSTEGAGTTITILLPEAE